MAQVIDITDIDVVFISYDEPQAEKNWLLLKRIAPWAQRVHGVKGSDAAHKAAAQLSTTDRVITIDGDNIVDPEFFDNMLVLTNENKDHTFSWRARNAVNGLYYGNGGIKCWPVQFIMDMKTHEASDGSDPSSIVEFCWEGKYTQMFNCYSTTHCNGSPYQAWRAGYREGVKLPLKRGLKPDRASFMSDVHRRNLELLRIWQTIGADAQNGIYAILGAKEGTCDLMLSDWNFAEVRDFEFLEKRWASVDHSNLEERSEELSKILKMGLNLNVPVMNADQSRFFKDFYKIPAAKEFMTTEMEVIRSVEGW
jgi:hypothetical protein